MSDTALTTGEQRDAINRIERQRKQRIQADLEWLMADERGRRLVCWLAYDLAGYDSQGYDAGIKYNLSEAMAFNEGRRSVGCAILDAAKQPGVGTYRKMLDERLAAIDNEMQSIAAAKEKSKAESQR